MTPLLVATRSPGKIAEFRALLAPWRLELRVPGDIGLTHTADEADLESGDTFEANAVAKARWFAARSGMPALADDSGLEVDALGGAPGVHSKRFAGRDGDDVGALSAANIALLLERLRDVPPSRRGARYRTVLALCWPPSPGPERPCAIAHGTTEGQILLRPTGSAGFGYDPVFFSDELRRGFGEVTAAEKGTVSHRARAIRQLAAVLEALAR